MPFTTSSGQKPLTHDSVLAPSLAAEQSPAPLVFSWHPDDRRRRAAHPVLASVSLSRAAPRGSRGRLAGFLGSLNLLSGPNRDAGLRRTFNSIDVDKKGHITEKDLEAFANRNGLPGSYAQNFVSAVLSSHSAATTAPTGGRQQRAESEQSEDVEVTFTLFKKFVRSREDALRRAFNMFDQDGDGRISVADLDASLGRVAVCCPKTRCIYRCRDHVAAHLYSKVAPEHGFLGFSEFRNFFLLLPQQDMLVEYWVAAGAAPELSDKLSVAGRTGAGVAGAKGSPWGHLLAGAVAGATSRTATAPLETLRLAAMAGQLQSRSLAQAASDIVSSQGWRGLYRGNMINVMRSAPQKALDFFVFDAFKRIIGDDTHAKTFLAAGLAGCTSWVALYPLEVVRSRITVAACAGAAGSLGADPSLKEALRTIVRREGAGALYKGLGPSVAAIFPEAAITYGLHDALKKVYTRLAHEEPGVAPSLAFGVLSAFMGQLVSFPLETVSRRLQVAQGGSSGLGAMGAVVRGLLAEGGPAALYRGIGAATLRLVPMACVSFGTYEAVRALVVAWEQRQDAQQVKAMLHSRCVPLVLHGPNGDQEVVGRLCTPHGATAPTLCGAANPGGCDTGPATIGLGALVEAVTATGLAAAGVPGAGAVGSAMGTGAAAGLMAAAPAHGPDATVLPATALTKAPCAGTCASAVAVAACGAGCCANASGGASSSSGGGSSGNACAGGSAAASS